MREFQYRNLEGLSNGCEIDISLKKCNGEMSLLTLTLDEAEGGSSRAPCKGLNFRKLVEPKRKLITSTHLHNASTIAAWLRPNQITFEGMERVQKILQMRKIE